MSRLSRFTQLIFGSSAGANTIAQFGSLAAAAPELYSGSTITPALVQALSNYLGAWQSAVIGSNSPAIEDMNALCYLYAYQLAYLFQAGIAEWDSGTTYYSGSMVNVSGVIYVATATSTNQQPPNGSYWGPLLLNSGTITPNTNIQSLTVPTGYTMNWDNPTIATGQTVIIATGAYLLCHTPFVPLTLSGTAVLTLSGTAQAKIYS